MAIGVLKALVSSIPIEVNGGGDGEEYTQLFGEITTHDTFQRGKRAMKVSSSRSCSSNADCRRDQCCAFDFGRKVCKASQRVRNLGETCSFVDIHKYLDLHDLTRSFTRCPMICKEGLRCWRTHERYSKSNTRKSVCRR
ncbi:uncharacterized protein LOC117115200 isoform X2 [Anneissia japonica]|uniref:uncharacterized protein LOC117115200 isoform X2 n=1 Tax=Anneissia japonica TaxID=1529436 RepID=UPI001425902D|nr:uncharacterized protein LOC117115200 isoform X2 [Anneissia japonica]